jgi:hypothetical protein
MEGLTEDVVKVRVTAPSPEEISILHILIHSNRSDIKTNKCKTLPPIIIFNINSSSKGKEQVKEDLLGSKYIPCFSPLVLRTG